jgi:hypothetical protein
MANLRVTLSAVSAKQQPHALVVLLKPCGPAVEKATQQLVIDDLQEQD